MATCDGIVYDSVSGEMRKAVEAKHRCPFVPSAGQAFFFKGSGMLALDKVPLEYFCQCQMQLLVQGLPHCDLISYGLSGSRILTISRDDQWLALALHLLAHLQKNYIQCDRVPEAVCTARRYSSSSQLSCCARSTAWQSFKVCHGSYVPSSINASACQMFLDDPPASNQQKREVGGHAFHYCKPAWRSTCSLQNLPDTLSFHAERLVGARQPELAQDAPADSRAAEPEEVTAEQPDDTQAPAEYEESQAQTAVMAQAEIEQAVNGSEPQPMEAEPAGRPRRTLKRSQKVLEGLEASGQQVSCLA